jgi:GTP cyclohydrolase I
MVLVRAVPFASLCEHHLLPFIGTATVGYIPKDNRVVGLSKIPRLVQAYAKRLQTQERLTTQIASTLMTVLAPMGVGVLIEAQHSCMQLRGIRSPGAMLTSCLLGYLRDGGRAEFLRLARRP